MSRPVTPPAKLCQLPHGMPCLAHAHVLQGLLTPCENCAPHAEDVKTAIRKQGGRFDSFSPVITRPKPQP